MPCCGNEKRIQAGQPQAHPGTVVAPNSILRAALFRYTGRTSMAAVGAVTRSIYRFGAPGATVIVDGRDVPSLARIPMLVRA